MIKKAFNSVINKLAEKLDNITPLKNFIAYVIRRVLNDLIDRDISF